MTEWLKGCEVCNAGLCARFDELTESGLSQRQAAKKLVEEQEEKLGGVVYSEGALRKRYSDNKPVKNQVVQNVPVEPAPEPTPAKPQVVEIPEPKADGYIVPLKCSDCDIFGDCSKADDKKRIDREECFVVKLPGEPVAVANESMQYAEMAIGQLEKVSDDDPLKEEAFARVHQYIDLRKGPLSCTFDDDAPLPDSFKNAFGAFYAQVQSARYDKWKDTPKETALFMVNTIRMLILAPQKK